ncbi:hypothetical protein CR969_00345 [Candidatus Saccharibacteria bacterium]|nr:MAG: hypothetical protein CR969_00345 [Candidatus Saccharibacteria bacterium]
MPRLLRSALTSSSISPATGGPTSYLLGGSGFGLGLGFGLGFGFGVGFGLGLCGFGGRGLGFTAGGAGFGLGLVFGFGLSVFLISCFGCFAFSLGSVLCASFTATFF